MPAPDPEKLQAFTGQVAVDLGAIGTGALVSLGDRLGLFKTMAQAGPSTSAELAVAAGVNERNLREWLHALAAAAYVDYEPGAERFSLNPEQEAVFANEGGPGFMAGGFAVLASMWIDEPRIAESYRTGRGLGWHERCDCLFPGTERFFRPGYNANLISAWIPALEGVEDKLKAGIEVADVGCGLGASTILMAQAYPNSRFHGFDYHGGSIEMAKQRASAAGVTNASFDVAPAASFGNGGSYGLVAIFDALHDMGDPVGAARHIRSRLTPDGTFMLVEPMAGDTLTENLNPVGRLYYAASAMLCTPASLSQEGQAALGAQAGEARLRKVAQDAGFTRVRRAAETPFNMVLELRP